MKHLLFLLVLVSSISYAQVYQPVTYNFNGTPTNGVKIKTNIPFTPSSHMPTIIIEGYNYGTSDAIGIMVNYYLYSATPTDTATYYFVKHNATSYGGYTPVIKLAKENNKIVIYIDSRDYFIRFMVRVFSKGLAEQASWFEGWTVVDEALTGTAQVTVPYRNRFKNEVLIDGRASVKSGSLGGIGFTNTANNYVNSIGSITGSDSTQAHLVFRTGTANASMNSLSERMRIDKDGNVAIGLTTALAKLHVATNATSIAAVQTIETIGTGGRPYTLYRAESSNYGYVGYGISSSNVMSVFNYKNAALQFGTNSAPRMSISADGKVGVGTLAPAYKLDVNGDIRVNKGSAIRFFRADSTTNGLNIYSATSNNFIHSATGGLIHISSAAISLDATSGHNFRNYDGSSTFMTISNTGNVGIGVAAPTKRLELGGSRSIAFDTGVGTMKIKADVGFWAMNYGFKGSSDTDWGGLWGHGSADALSHWSIGKSYLDNFLVVKNSGQIGIGTTTIPTDYKLAVAGNIIAEKVKVKKQVNGAWPDYVFSPTYKLPSLEEIEQFTKKNNHLPEIPSAREIENEGQDLGEMNRLLLKKVEELTLYMIEQNKNIIQQNKEIKELKLKVEQLEKK